MQESPALPSEVFETDETGEPESTDSTISAAEGGPEGEVENV